MKRLFVALLVLFIPVLVVFADGIQSVWPGGPTVTEQRVYWQGSNSAVVSIALSGFTDNSYIRVLKSADEPGWYTIGSNRHRFETEMNWVYAGPSGLVYFTDTSVKPGSWYTYTFIDSLGLRAIVPVEVYAIQFTFYPNQVACVAQQASHLFIGAEGKALTYQPGYTRATVDPSYSEQTNIGLFQGDHFVVVNGPVCDGRSIWWQVDTAKNAMQYDQTMYIRENHGTAYLVQPTGAVQASVPFSRLLPGTDPFWTPVSDRFDINIRTLPTWCQQDGADIAPVIAQAEAGELFEVLAITSDSQWVLLQLSDGRTGWAATHFGNVNFYVPFLSYGNMDGLFVFPPLVFDPAGVPPWQSCGN